MTGPEGWGTPLHERVLAGVPRGSSVLDVGCGAGAFAAFAVDRGLRVTGIDPDPSALVRAAVTAPGARFVPGDAHALEAGPGEYDLVALVQVLGHLADPMRALQEAGRVGGLVRATVWGRDEESDVRLFGEALAPFLPPRPAPESAPLTDPERLRALARLAGLEVTALDEVLCPFDYPDEDALVGPLLESGIGRFAVNRVGPEKVRAAVLDRFAGLRNGAGYRLTTVFRVLDARPGRR